MWAPNRVEIALSVLVILLCDVSFIAFDAIGGPGIPDALHVYREGGIPEWFQWLQLLASGVVLLILARRTVGLYFVWAGIFFYLLADDALMGHERVAGHLIRGLNLEHALKLPFPAYTLIEVLYMAVVGVVVLLVLRHVDTRASSATARRYTIEGLVLLTVLVGFAGAGDFIGRVVFGGSHLSEVVEDGGEMIVVTLLLGHAFRQLTIERNVVPLRGRRESHVFDSR